MRELKQIKTEQQIPTVIFKFYDSNDCLFQTNTGMNAPCERERESGMEGRERRWHTNKHLDMREINQKLLESVSGFFVVVGKQSL